MNTQNFVEEQPELKKPIGSFLLIASQIISFLSVMIPQIQQIFERMGDSYNGGYSDSFGQIYHVVYSYIDLSSLMGIFLLSAIAILAIKNQHKLINLVLLSELAIMSGLNLLSVLLNLNQFNYYYSYDLSYYSYGDAATAILQNLSYLLLVLTVLVFALRDYGVSAVKASNKVIMIVSIVSLVGVMYANMPKLIGALDTIYGTSVLSIVASILTYIALFLIGRRFANPYKKASTQGEVAEDAETEQ